MDKDELKPEPQLEVSEVEADGYYGEDETGAEDLDLSFLDEDDEEEKPAKPEA